MKKCFKCLKVKPLSEFYKHKQMADGHLNKCKDCTKKDSTEYRNLNIDVCREYDRKRGNRQPTGYLKAYRKNNSAKYSATTAVNNAVRAGILIPMPCECCGSKGLKTHAHHDDYRKPLDVRWLCPVCHKAWHTKNGDGLNG